MSALACMYLWWQLLNSATIWILVPLSIFMIPIVAILVNPMLEMMRQRERREARKLYERIVTEKLDVIRTALAMGQTKDDLVELDVRLEQLIGTDELKSLLHKKVPKAPELKTDLMDADLEAEVERLTTQRKPSKNKQS